MKIICGYCKRNFDARNSSQKYCCDSCRNCAHSLRRMREKNEESLLRASGYYATELGRDEVANGLHDDTLAKHEMSRSGWLVSWKLKFGAA